MTFTAGIPFHHLQPSRCCHSQPVPDREGQILPNSSQTHPKQGKMSWRMGWMKLCKADEFGFICGQNPGSFPVAPGIHLWHMDFSKETQILLLVSPGKPQSPPHPWKGRGKLRRIGDGKDGKGFFVFLGRHPWKEQLLGSLSPGMIHQEHALVWLLRSGPALQGRSLRMEGKRDWSHFMRSSHPRLTPDSAQSEKQHPKGFYHSFPSRNLAAFLGQESSLALIFSE